MANNITFFGSERQKKSTPISIFKKTRIYSSVIGSHSTISPNNITSFPNNVAGSPNNITGSPNNIASTRDSSPPKFDDEILKRWTSRASSDISNIQAPSSDFFTKFKKRYRSGTTSLNNETSSQSRAYPLKRKLDDTDFDQMADFVLGVFRKIKEKKTGKTENRSFHWRKTKP
uniref:Uncharacterized protein n=1 Tax=Rhizophagus irregularis (strain DAOM 181602 / DAOM 197198 / MUCL 43194) TaxID=747089 RepID=U9UQH8_RHIID